MAHKVEEKKEFLVLNIGSGVQEGASVTVVGVAESIGTAKDLVRKMRGAVTGRIAIVEKRMVITRTPVVDLKESDESVLSINEIRKSQQ
ncbi:MAG: hypothetical protein HY735_10405 [Verrucomicrobia bacterium]|nr:hypothetical protein [Verrucomicrobiota bacterium]MBI4659241.1 hypothetical protein [Verrucomicrobiota bacterium]